MSEERLDLWPLVAFGGMFIIIAISYWFVLFSGVFPSWISTLSGGNGPTVYAIGLISLMAIGGGVAWIWAVINWWPVPKEAKKPRYDAEDTMAEGY